MFKDWVAWTKPVVFLAALGPLAWLVYNASINSLGADPVREITHETGIWTFRFLLLTLAMTPLRRAIGRPWPIRYRRMLGLFTYFYASLHLATYVVLDLGLYWPILLEDIAKRPYITVGFTAWLMLTALAVTSTRAAQRRLKRRWQQLHRLVYVIFGLAALHFLWLVKADLREPLIYAGIGGGLLLLRFWRRPGRVRSSAAAAR